MLSAEDYKVQCHPGDRLTVDAINQLRPDLVIMEQWRNCPEVLQLIDQLQQCDATHSIAVIVTTTDPLMLYEQAMQLHERGCTMLLKPFDLDQLLERVGGALSAGS
jgi:DNA-binding NtrC family response regulator